VCAFVFNITEQMHYSNCSSH